MPLAPANSISASPRAPLWVAKATLPAVGTSGAKLTLSPPSGLVSMTPRQLGPTSLIPASRQTASSSRSRATPSSPTSLKPAERTTRLLAPLGDAFARYLRHGLGADGDHREVDLLRDVGDAGVGRNRLDAVGGRVDRVDRALEGRLDEVVEDLAADGATAAGGADDRDRSRPKKPVDGGPGGDRVALLEAGDRLRRQRGRELDPQPLGCSIRSRPESRSRGTCRSCGDWRAAPRPGRS